jgi:hypothetical protein
MERAKKALTAISAKTVKKSNPYDNAPASKLEIRRKAT